MRRFHLLLVLLLTSSLTASLYAQFNIKNRMGEELLNPWAGGLDACQFGRMDLDRDGKKDLLVFDRRGNRLLTYLNKGSQGEIDYDPAPQYVSFFPVFNEWVIFTDYDGDGFEDIFTYSQGWAGIKVYRHLGTYPPDFELVVTPYLTSFQGGGYVNILATNADYPALYDVDQDGDLDLLSFWSLGTFIELHTNRSMELYGHADSLVYERTDFCWGRVAENEETNEMYLDTCLFKQSSLAAGRTNRHRGATFGVKDLNNDGLPELMLADVDYPGITMFTNGGTVDQALMIHQDTAFPSNSTPVRLFSMPLPYFTDINNDGLSDMLVSPFDPNYEVTENVNNVWLYLNEGTENESDFRLVQRDFLQEEMLDFGSGAYPLLADMDGDGSNDLLVGNWGTYQFSWYVGGTLFSRQQSQLSYFKGFSTENTDVFQLENNNYGNLFSKNLRGLYPAAGDLNGDGLTDLLVGNELGTVIYLQQQANGIFWEAAESFMQIDVGSYSAPQLFDLDRDGILD
ncbi:MAG TPA: VCBS repeat-containing protein, partial [Bacteroidales bacterium]|nr:VCBS repeat-containing protein [Bacteroidales bacterium]